MTDPGSIEAPHFPCPECDYDLTGAPGPRCPWCGWEINVDALVAAGHPLHAVERWGTVATAGLVGFGSLLAVVVLSSRASRLTLYDAVALISILIAAAGHVSLVIMAVRSKGRWPLRAPEAATILRFMGWLSLVGGVASATQALHVPPSRRMIQGVLVSGALDFVLRAVFFSLPGMTLLALRLGSFRRRGAPADPRASPPQNSGAADADRAPFVLEALGPFGKEQVTQRQRNEPRPSTAEIDAIIAHVWETEMQGAAKAGRTLYDTGLARLVRSRVSPGSLHLEFGSTNYRDFLGTNLHNAISVMSHHPDALSNAVGTSAVVVTRDGYLALGRRNDRVAYHAGYLHPFGGMLEASDRDAAGRFDVFAAVLRELQEELGVVGDDILELTLTGIIRDRSIFQPELVFDATVRPSRENLSARSDRAEFTEEHRSIEFVRDEPEAVAGFLARAERVTPVAQGALLLRGRREWGSDWYEQTCYLLYGEVPPYIGSPVAA